MADGDEGSFVGCDAIVIDNGSGSVKVGLAGEDAPLAVFPSLVGTGKDNAESFVGHDAQLHAEVASLKHPIERGVITNWDAMVKIWEYAMDSDMLVGGRWRAGARAGATGGKPPDVVDVTHLNRSPAPTPGPQPEGSELPVLMTDAPLSPRKDREKMAEIMFETFNVPGMYIAVQAVLALAASWTSKNVSLSLITKSASLTYL